MSGGVADREGDTESGAGSRLRASSTERDVEPEPTNQAAQGFFSVIEVHIHREIQ